MEQDPMQSDRRKRHWKKKFGPNPVCILCRFNLPEGFILVPWSLIEAHHVAGRAHEPDLTVPVCKNCHAILTELNRCNGATMQQTANLLEYIITVLRALGGFFPILGESFAQTAERLSQFAEALDERYPEWREMKEAR